MRTFFLVVVAALVCFLLAAITFPQETSDDLQEKLRELGLSEPTRIFLTALAAHVKLAEGSKAYLAGDMNGAIEAWSRALAILETIDGTASKRDQADCHAIMGRALAEMGNHEEAIEELETALTIYRSFEDTGIKQSSCHMEISKVLLNMGRHAPAIAEAEQALRILQQISDTELYQAECHVLIGDALCSMSRHHEGIERYEQALNICENTTSAEEARAQCYMKIGVALSNAGKHDEAIEKYEQGLRIFQTIEGTDKEQAGCYGLIGIALGEVGRYGEAIAMNERSLGIWKAIDGTEHEQAACYQNIAFDLIGIPLLEEAIAKAEQALDIFQSMKDTEQEQAYCHMTVGNAFQYLGMLEEAVAEHEQALMLLQTTENARDTAGCYQNIGSALASMGMYEEAIENCEQALRIFKAIPGTGKEQANCYQTISITLRDTRQYDEAIAQCKKAIEILQVEGPKADEGRCWASLGAAYLCSGEFSKATAAYERAQEFANGWWISRGLANAYRRRGEPGDEQRAARQFWKAVKTVEDIYGSILALEHRAGFFQDPSEIFPDFVSLLIELTEKKVTVDEPGLLQWTQDEKAQIALLEAAFHFADRGKGRALVDALRERASLQAITPDEQLLVEDRELSLRISNLTAQKEHLTHSGEGNLAGDTRRPATPADVETAKASQRLQELERQIKTLQQRRNQIEVELKRTALGHYLAPYLRKPMDIAKELPADTAVLQYSVGEKEGYLLILTQNGVIAYRLGVNIPALPELMARQEADILELVRAWKERPEQVGLDGLVRLARERAEDLAKKQKRYLVSASQETTILERLGHVVLPEPALSKLRERGIKHLLVIPDGVLHYLPFAMLRIPGKDTGIHYLVEEFSLRYTPAMTTLDTIRSQKQEREQTRQYERRWFLAFANPDFGGEIPPDDVDSDKSKSLASVRSFRSRYYGSIGLRLDPLPETEGEAKASASQYGEVEHHSRPTVDIPGGQAVVYTGQGASETQVKRILGAIDRQNPRWRYILFSTHGLVDTQNGMLSCLAFSPPSGDTDEDGLLQAQEILSFQLDTDLVMLSACETGLGRKRSGEGLVGLSASFFYAGTDSVCASLWRVPSDATSQLVVEFFKHLKAGKLEKAEALRQAQLTVMRSGTDSKGKPADYSSPFYWAAFVLMGE